MNFKKSERECYFTEIEFRRLLAAAKALGNRHRIIVMAGGTLGCRIGETVLLRHEMFGSLESNVVKVHRLKRRKNSPECEVALSDEWVRGWREVLEEALRENDRRPERQWLLPGQDENHLCRHRAIQLFKEVLKKAKISSRYSTHALRHYCGVASWILSRDIVYVKNQLGHSNLKYSERYIHMSIEDRVKVARGIKQGG